MSQTALFFGSFNPIHHGHLGVAKAALQTQRIEQVRFVVTPQNPFKKQADLLPEQQRLALAEKVLENQPNMSVSDVEFHLPKPSYTLDTLRHLIQQDAAASYVLLMGADTFAQIPQWKKGLELLDYEIMIYPRMGFDLPTPGEKRILIDAPFMDISATQVRDKIKAGEAVDHLVSQVVADFLATLQH